MVLKSDIPHILAVDDDDRIRRLLAQYLNKNGYIIVTAENASEARLILKDYTFDLCVLDIMMPGETGLDLGKYIKSAYDIPILFLTAMGESQDRINGLEIGADDYLPKPFEPRELLLRINSIIKRTNSFRKANILNKIVLDDLIIDQGGDIVSKNNQDIYLTDSERSLLKVLIQKPNIPIRREMLAARLGEDVNDRAIDVQITRLRKKIEDNPAQPQFIQTIRGKGYMIKV
jgi:two-component system phosphate regulon response regulator OmpR